MLAKYILVLISDRANYGRLKPVMNLLELDSRVKLGVLATGTVLLKKFGKCIEQIKKDGFSIHSEIYMEYMGSTDQTMALSIGSGITQISNEIKRLKPDIFLIIGDRYEALAASIAAVYNNTLIAHIQGGEVSGSIDESARHCITKLSHIHFPSTEKSKERILKMGENPKHVYNYGSLSLENINKLKKIELKSIEKEYKFKFKKKYLLVCYHPETLSSKNKKNILSLISAILKFKNIQFIFTSSNSDEGGDKINKIINKVSKKYKNIVFVKSFGQEKYLNVLKFSNGIIGNSSSGVHEAPSFKIGSLNLGNRQKGRLKIKTIINSNFEIKNIIKGINKILSKNFKNNIKLFKNPYYKKDTSENIIRKIFSFKERDLLIKKFYG